MMESGSTDFSSQAYDLIQQFNAILNAQNRTIEEKQSYIKKVTTKKLL